MWRRRAPLPRGSELGPGRSVFGVDTDDPKGPMVAWFATAPGETVYPAFRHVGSSGGAVLSSFQEPIWLAVQGSTLIWVAVSADGSSTEAYAVDVSGLGPR